MESTEPRSSVKKMWATNIDPLVVFEILRSRYVVDSDLDYSAEFIYECVLKEIQAFGNGGVYEGDEETIEMTEPLFSLLSCNGAYDLVDIECSPYSIMLNCSDRVQREFPLVLLSVRN